MGVGPIGQAIRPLSSFCCSPTRGCGAVPRHRLDDSSTSLASGIFRSKPTRVRQCTYLPAEEPPRVPIDLVAERIEPSSVGDEPIYRFKLDPSEMVISGEDNVDEILSPGIAEWGLTRADGSGQVIPDAAVIHIGEGDLSRADPASIAQQLLPLEVKFVSSSVWSEENRTAGSSTLDAVAAWVCWERFSPANNCWPIGPATMSRLARSAQVTRSHAGNGRDLSMNESADVTPLDSSQIVYEFARASTLEGWWVWALMVGALGVLLVSCVCVFIDAMFRNCPNRSGSL